MSDIKELSFEKALGQLEDIIRKLEQGGLDLDEAIEQFSQGDKLRKHCTKKLQSAKLKVQKIIAVNEDGSTESEKFSV